MKICINVYEDSEGAEVPSVAGVEFTFADISEAFDMAKKCLEQGKYITMVMGSENE